MMVLSLIKLTRPLNVVITGVSVLIAASLSVSFGFSQTLILSIISASLVTAAANIVNDIYDREIDKINKPERVLASGKISIRNAWVAYLIINVLAIVSAGFAGLLLFVIALFSAVVLYFYSSYFKRTILAGNFIVSLISGLAFIFGAVAVNDWFVGIAPAVFAFLFHFGREIVKDLEDVQGDLASEVVTFAGRFGKQKSILLINAIFILLILFLFAPFVLNQYNIYYIYVIIPGVATVLLFISILLWFKNDVKWLNKISLTLKVDMFIGLCAIYLGANHDIFSYY